MKLQFVKFVPYNEKTISNLINKNVKFSTVYEFNDFNELHYISPPPDFITPILQTLIQNYLYSNQENCKLINNIKKGNYDKAFIRELCEYCKKFNLPSELPKKYLQCLLETIVYSSVGIFCVSSIDVFKDDSAQLMFAHYAENLTGLALIYEINDDRNTILPVEYIKLTKKSSSGGEVERELDWVGGTYHPNHMDDFLTKSNKWEYENEYRIFNTPGIKPISKLILKAILYTSRFNYQHRQLLDILNAKIYEDKIIIQEIKSSYSYYYFVIQENNKCVNEWLQET